MTVFQSLLHALTEPWTRDSLRVYWPILAEGALVSVALGLIGCFLVVRGMSLLGDALSHSVLPGIVVGFLIGGSLHSPWILIGATAVGLGAAFLVQNIHTASRVKEDASLGIVFTSLFALGVVLINVYAGQADLDPGCVLYGNIESFIVDRGGIRPMAVVLACVLIGLVVFYRPLLVSTFDPTLARSLGVRVALVQYGLMAALSLTIVTSFEAVGAILAVALLIMPGATARLWTDRMPSMLLIAAAHALASTALGYWLSHPAAGNTSASGAICVAGFALFLASWLVAPRYGLVHRALQRRRLKRTVELENVVKAVEEAGGGATVEWLASDARMTRRQAAKLVARGIARGWMTRTDGRIALTDTGRTAARRLTRAHELWEAFLKREVGLPDDHVHDAAEWIEHHLDDERLAEVAGVVGGSPGEPASAGGSRSESTPKR
ncbi:MAG: metal ABC transporter permease [Phycisphaerae bacterium]|nr:metal ABC transporter permease [Tepidisphaeraceae bacterium]